MIENLHKGHRKRLKEQFVIDGLDSFKDHQVLELLLFYAIPQKDTNELAHKMIEEFGSLSALFDADPKEIGRRCKVSDSTAVLISLIPSLSKRYMTDRWKGKRVLNSVSKAGEYTVTHFIDKKYENFYLICLDSQNKEIFTALVHEGTIGEVPVYPRIIVETALRHKAHSVILAHNHPGGSLTPSQDDMDITRTIIAALEPIGITVRDHFIVAGSNYYSMKQNNCF